MESEESNRPLDEERRIFLGQCRSMLAGLAVVGISMPLLQGCETERVLSPDGAGTTMEVDVTPLVNDGDFVLVEDPNQAQIIVVRTGLGSYVALSTTCTHEGCPVNPPLDRKVMICPCHASEFNIDGTVKKG